MTAFHVNLAGPTWGHRCDSLIVTAQAPHEGDIVGPYFDTEEDANEARMTMFNLNMDYAPSVALLASLQTPVVAAEPRCTVVQTYHTSSLLVFPEGHSTNTLDDVNGPSFADASTAEAWAEAWDHACDVQDFNLLLTLARLAQDGKAAPTE